MAKKKVNPNKIPVGDSALDMEELTTEATNNMVLKAWALMLGALADFDGTTQAMLVDLWEAVNKYSSTMHTYEDIEEELKAIERYAGVSVPYHRICAANIKTQGALNKLKKQLSRNALYTAFALIASPIIHEQLVAEKNIPRLLRKACALEEEIATKRISLQDITEYVLEAEYALRLVMDKDGNVALYTIDPTAAAARE